jgi:hypothetical protein
VSEGRKLNGSLSLTFGPKRIEAIWDLPLVDLRNGTLIKLSALLGSYFPERLAGVKYRF